MIVGHRQYGAWVLAGILGTLAVARAEEDTPDWEGKYRALQARALELEAVVEDLNVSVGVLRAQLLNKDLFPPNFVNIGRAAIRPFVASGFDRGSREKQGVCQKGAAHAKVVEPASRNACTRRLSGSPLPALMLGVSPAAVVHIKRRAAAAVLDAWGCEGLEEALIPEPWWRRRLANA